MNDIDLFHRIENFINSRQYESALSGIEEAKKGCEPSGRLLFLEAVIYHRQDRYEPALGLYRKALAMDPALVVGWKNLAALCFNNDESQGVVDALAGYRELVPYDREVYGWLIFSLANLNRLQEAEEVVDDYRNVYPHDPRVLAGWAYVLEKQRRFINALLVSCTVNAENLEDSLVGHVALASSHNLGNQGMSRALLDQVFQSSDREEDPDYLLSLADLVALEGDLVTAREYYSRAVERGYSDPDGLLNIALVHLSSGDYEQGWKFYLQRSSRYKRMGVIGIPEWKGEPLQGKTILVHSEQGFGDVIQFIRYLPYLRETGAQVIFNTYPDVLQLLKQDARTGGEVEFHLDSLDQCDFQTYMMDFPALLRPRGIADFPADVPYLHANPEKVVSWKQKLSKYQGVRIGFVWRGNPDHFNDHNRSAAFSDFALLGSMPGITWFSLQKGLGEQELGSVPAGMALVNLAPELTDFSETAAVVSNLDLVICVDTSVAHLVGAMGYECWLLLPAEQQDWRWRLDDQSTPWYPQMRLFSQKKRRDWAGLIECVVRPALAKWVLERHGAALGDHDRVGLDWHAGGNVTEQALAVWSEIGESEPNQQLALATARWLALRRSDTRPLDHLRSDIRFDRIRPLVEGVWTEFLLCRGDVDGATECWKKLDHPTADVTADAMVAWIAALIQRRDLEQAEYWIRKALSTFPENGILHLQAAKSASLQEKKDAASELAELAIRYSPRHVDAHLALARLVGEKDRLRAADCFQRAVQLSSEDYPIWVEIARFALANRSPRLAALIFASLLARQHSEGLSVMLGAALAEAGARQDALNILQGVDCSRLEEGEHQYMLAMAQGRLGLDDAQEVTLRNLLVKQSEMKKAHFMLGMVLLRNGRCSEGWSEYNLGLDLQRYLSLPEWKGESLAGKHLLVYQDQGYGDLIQFFTLLGGIDRSCQVTLTVMPDIVELVRSQDMRFRVFSQTADADQVQSLVNAGEFDYQIPFMKLPYFLGADLTQISRSYPYLSVSTDFMPLEWASQCAADNNFKIGVAWAGNPNYSNDHHRSTNLDDWLPLASIPGVSFYSFQKDAASSQAYACPQFSFKNIAADCDSLLKTASALQFMDLFVSVDTGLAHLSAALGKETWILLPDIGTDWRWLKDREDSPWYPAARLFRRTPGERWASVLMRLASELESRLKR